MGCACKHKVELEDKYGVKENENILEKANRYLMRVVFFIIILALALVLIPVLVLVFVFQAAFMPNKLGIKLPSFMSKYMR